MKKYKKIRAGFIALIVIYFAVLLVLRSGLIGSPEKKLEEIENVGESFDELEIPEGIKVVGIGEATHGNCEFQTAKLEMLQKLVETGKCHSIAFEMSAGEAAEYNDAIHNNEAVLADLIGKTDYPIYDTKQMVELLQWMRDFNKDKSYEESVVFYGVDMQGPDREVGYLLEYSNRHPEAFSEEEKDTLSEMAANPDCPYEEYKDFFTALDKRLSAENDAELRGLAILARVVTEWIDAPSFEADEKKYSAHRDLCMAKNLKSYYEIETERGYSQILVTAHNGHVMRGDAEGFGNVGMGSRIDEIFDGSYFCVGTGFYNTCVNVHTAGTYDDEYLREDHNYCSSDILAYQAKFFEGERYCLDFTKVTDKNSKVYKCIHTPAFMGSFGEGYNKWQDFSRAYRSKLVQGDRFDAVIYYYNATPIRTLH